MPYGLLNALPTFARAMNITLGDLVRDIVEVYVCHTLKYLILGCDSLLQ
jgi:hypothetical protein